MSLKLSDFHDVMIAFIILQRMLVSVIIDIGLCRPQFTQLVYVQSVNAGETKLFAIKTVDGIISNISDDMLRKSIEDFCEKCKLGTI